MNEQRVNALMEGHDATLDVSDDLLQEAKLIKMDLFVRQT